LECRRRSLHYAIVSSPILQLESIIDYPVTIEVVTPSIGTEMPLHTHTRVIAMMHRKFLPPVNLKRNRGS